MANYSERIIELRKIKNLTQADLGKQLNVTPQAVSKWEKGQSEPDLQTVQRICELYNVTTDWVLGKSDVQQMVEQPLVENSSNTIIRGYCDRCKKPVKNGEYVVTRGYENEQQIFCNKCKEELDKEEHDREKTGALKTIKKGFLWGGILGVALIILGTVLSIIYKDIDTFIGSLVIGIVAFTFTSQMIWDRSVNDCYWFFQRSFRMPGVIFELSLDGLLFLIFVKILFGVISWLLSAICYLVGLVVCFIYSVISFPFATINVFREYKKI